MDINLSGKRALVCGSTKGIGRAAAFEFASLGASVTALARDPEALASLAAALPRPAGQTHRHYAADFNDPIAVKQAAEAALRDAGPHLILVNNTGGPPAGPALDASPQDYLAALTAHLVCNQLLAQALVPGMKAAAYGRIVNIISTSVKAPIPGLGVSNATRGAVASWAKTLAWELAPFGITVNNVLPGFTDTQRLAELFKGRAAKSGKTLDEVTKDALAGIPAARLARPEEVAAAIAFLASPAAAYINGINLPVDGGRTQSL